MSISIRSSGGASVLGKKASRRSTASMTFLSLDRTSTQAPCSRRCVVPRLPMTEAPDGAESADEVALLEIHVAVNRSQRWPVGRPWPRSRNGWQYLRATTRLQPTDTRDGQRGDDREQRVLPPRSLRRRGAIPPERVR